MKTSEDRQIWRFVMNAAFWLGLLFLAYFLSTGPVTRFAPDVADKIYAPLSSLGDNKAFGPMLRKWLSLWGVETGE